MNWTDILTYGQQFWAGIHLLPYLDAAPLYARAGSGATRRRHFIEPLCG